MMLRERIHLFEFSDLPRWPSVLRTYALDYLLAVAERFRPFSLKVDLLLQAMDAVGTDQIVDLCSGVGGPWPHLAPEMARRRGRPIQLLLSDKYLAPGVESVVAAIPGARCLKESVDARCVPPQLTGMRTLFNGFHHFRPDEARQILQDAVRHNQPIAVFEMLERSWWYFIYLWLTPFLVLLITPKLRPVRLSRLLLSFVVPVIPLCMLWDSLVSVLRCYTTRELLDMVAGLDGNEYVWEAGRYRHRIIPVTYLVGYPRRAKASAPQQAMDGETTAPADA
jgi:hypothetical protein